MMPGSPRPRHDAANCACEEIKSTTHSVKKSVGPKDTYPVRGVKIIQNFLCLVLNNSSFQRWISERNFTYNCLISPVLLGSKLFLISGVFFPLDNYGLVL